MSVGGINTIGLNGDTVITNIDNRVTNNNNFFISGTGGLIAAGISGSPLFTGTLGITGIGGMSVTLQTGLSASGFSGLFVISGGAGGSAFSATTSGTISGFTDLLFNHGLNSNNIQPTLFIRNFASNNWSTPAWPYNDTIFQKDFSTFGFFDFKTGAITFNGWSGFNLGNCSMLGFSGGSGRIVGNSNAADQLTTANNGLSAPCIVKRIAGDFDVWTKITGFYTGGGYQHNGITAMSINMTGGATSVLAWTMGAFGGVRQKSLKLRDQHGNNGGFGEDGLPSFIRLSRVGSNFTAYFKTGVNDSWINEVVNVTGRTLLMTPLSDDIYLGMSFITDVTISNGKEYIWEFFKTWSPIELIGSGLNNIVIRNNTSITYDFKVTA